MNAQSEHILRSALALPESERADIAASLIRSLGPQLGLQTEYYQLMNTKDKAIAVIHSLDDDVTLDEVIDRLYLLRKIELGLAQAEAGDVMEHEQFMFELEREDAQ